MSPPAHFLLSLAAQGARPVKRGSGRGGRGR